MGTTLLDKKEKAATVAAVKSRLTRTVGGMIDQLESLRDVKRELEAKATAIAAEMLGIETTLMSEMDRQGLAKASGAKATVSLSSSEMTTVEDWDQFYAFIYENRYGHLMERRPSNLACREIRELGKTIPGTTVFTKKRINLRSI